MHKRGEMMQENNTCINGLQILSKKIIDHDDFGMSVLIIFLLIIVYLMYVFTGDPIPGKYGYYSMIADYYIANIW